MDDFLPLGTISSACYGLRAGAGFALELYRFKNLRRIERLRRKRRFREDDHTLRDHWIDEINDHAAPLVRWRTKLRTSGSEVPPLIPTPCT